MQRTPRLAQDHHPDQFPTPPVLVQPVELGAGTYIELQPIVRNVHAILGELAQILGRPGNLMRLGEIRGRGISDPKRVKALNELTAMPEVQTALTWHLSPADADQLAEDIRRAVDGE